MVVRGENESEESTSYATIDAIAVYLASEETELDALAENATSAEARAQQDGSLVGGDGTPPANHQSQRSRSPSLPTHVSWLHPTSVLSVLVVLLSMGAFGLHFALQATSWLDTLASEQCDPKFQYGTCQTRRAWMGVTPEVEAVVWVLCVGGILICSAILAKITCLWRRSLLKELRETGLVRTASRKMSTTRAGEKVAEAARAFEGGLGFERSESEERRANHVRCCFRCGQCVSTVAAVIGWAEYLSGAHSPQFFRLQFVSEVVESFFQAVAVVEYSRTGISAELLAVYVGVLFVNSATPLFLAVLQRRQKSHENLGRRLAWLLLLDACCDLFYSTFALLNLLGALLTLRSENNKPIKCTGSATGICGTMNFDVLHSAGRDVFLGGAGFWVVLIKAFSTLFPLVSAPLRAYNAFTVRVFLAQTDAPQRRNKSKEQKRRQQRTPSPMSAAQSAAVSATPPPAAEISRPAEGKDGERDLAGGGQDSRQNAPASVDTTRRPSLHLGPLHLKGRQDEHREMYYLPIPMPAVALHVSLALLFCLGSWVLLIVASVANPSSSCERSSFGCAAPAAPVFDLLTNPTTVPCACTTLVYPMGQGSRTDWEDDREWLGNLSASRAVQYTTVAITAFSFGDSFGKGGDDYHSSVNSFLEILAKQATQIRTLSVYSHQNVYSDQTGQTGFPDLDFHNICKLTTLEQLKISGKGLNMDRGLPSCIGEMTNLVTLSLFNFNFTSLPTSLGKLTQLRDFMITQNPGTERMISAGLPPNIGDLTSLQRLVRQRSSGGKTNLPCRVV